LASTTTPSPTTDATSRAAADADARAASFDAPDDAPDADQVLVVELGERAYALAAAEVREVARAAPVTPLPGTPAWVLGLAAVRGAVLPVGDVQRLAGAPAADARDGWWVVVDDGRRGAALAGWRVCGVASAPHADNACAGADAGADAGAAARDGAGLPVRGGVRLSEDGGRGGTWAPPGAVARLDVAALLDDLYDRGG
jgi:purine-binding chemotaxis protein CheW